MPDKIFKKDFLPTILNDETSTLLYSVSPESKEILKTRQPAPPEWKPGDIISGLYKVISILGEGAYGTVYKVLHQGWNKELAVKILHSHLAENKEQRENFIKECEGWINLGLHPHIAACHYVRDTGEIPAIFMEYMDEGTLRNRLREGREKNWQEILDWAFQCLYGLSFAHSKNLIHCDIKPENCLLGRGNILKITDFGITFIRDDEKFGPAGTPSYMAPEQWGEEEVDHRSDIYSFGIMLYEICSGKRPFDKGIEHSGVIKLRHISSIPEDPRKVNPEIPEGLSLFILKCIGKAPSDRFPHCFEAIKDLLSIYHRITGESYERPVPKEIDLLADSLNNRAVSFMDLGQDEKAIEYWDKAIQKDPLHVRSVFNRGLVKWRKGLIDDLDLLGELDQVKNEIPENKDIDYLTALVHMERDDCEKAVEAFRKAGIDKNNPLLKEAEYRLSVSSSLKKAFYNDGFQPVEGLTISEDERWIFSWGMDNLEIHIPSGEVKRDRKIQISSVALNRAGKIKATGYTNGFIKVHNLITGEEVGSFNNKWSLTYINISSDGKFIAAATRYNTINLWETFSGKFIREFKADEGKVFAASLSSDNKYLMAGFEQGVFKIWHISTGECINSFSHASRIIAADFSGDGKRALSVSNDGKVKLWDTDRVCCIKTFYSPSIEFFRKERTYRFQTPVKLSEDGKWLIAAGKNNKVKLFCTQTSKCVRSFEGHNKRVESVAIKRDGRLAVSGDYIGQVKIWKIEPANFNRISSFALSSAEETEALNVPWEKYKKLMGEAKKELEKRNWKKTKEILLQVRELKDYERAPEALKLWKELALYCRKTGVRAVWPDKKFSIKEDVLYRAHIDEKGIWAVSGNRQGMFKVRDISENKVRNTFAGKEEWGTIFSVDINKDRSLLITGYGDGTVRLWDVFSGELKKTLKAHNKRITGVFFTYHDRQAISASYDNTVKILDLFSGNLLAGEEAGTVISIAVNKYRTEALTAGGLDKTIKLWDSLAGTPLKTMDGHKEGVFSVDISPDGTRAISGSPDNTLRLWDLTGGKCIKVIEDSEDIGKVALSPDSLYALSCSSDFTPDSKKTLKLWDLTSGECMRVLERGKAYRSIAFSPDGLFVMAGSTNRTLMVWQLDFDLDTVEEMDWHERGEAYLESFLESSETFPDEKELGDFLRNLSFAGYGWLPAEKIKSKAEELFNNKIIYPSLLEKARGEIENNNMSGALHLLKDIKKIKKSREVIKLWETLYPYFPKKDLLSVTLLNSFKVFGNIINCSSISKDGKFIMSGTGRVEFRHSFNSRIIMSTSKYTGPVRSLSLTFDGKFILAGYEDGKIRLWSIGTGECIRIFEGHKKRAASIFLTSSGDEFLSASSDMTVKLWNINTGKCKKTFKGHNNILWKVIHAGKRVISAGMENMMKIWDLNTGKLIKNLEGHSDSVISLDLDKSGTILLSGSRDNTLRLWDLSSGKCVRTIKVTEEFINRALITPYGKWIVGAGEEKLGLWEADSGNLVKTMDFFHKGISYFEMSSDGAYLLTRNLVGPVKLWRLEWDL